MLTLTDVVLERAMPFVMDHRMQNRSSEEAMAFVLSIDAASGSALDSSDLCGQSLEVVCSLPDDERIDGFESVEFIHHDVCINCTRPSHAQNHERDNQCADGCNDQRILFPIEQ